MLGLHENSTLEWRQRDRPPQWLERRTCNLELPLSPLAGFVHGSPEFKSPTMLVNSQLVSLWPVGLLILLSLQFELCVSGICSSPLALVL